MSTLYHTLLFYLTTSKNFSVFFFIFFFFFSFSSTTNCPESAATLHLHLTLFKLIPVSFMTSPDKKTICFSKRSLPLRSFGFHLLSSLPIVKPPRPIRSPRNHVPRLLFLIAFVSPHPIYYYSGYTVTVSSPSFYFQLRRCRSRYQSYTTYYSSKIKEIVLS